MNYEHHLSSIATGPRRVPKKRKPLPSHFVLASPLQCYSDIERDAIGTSHETRRQYILQQALTTAVQTPIDAKPAPKPDNPRRSSSAFSQDDAYTTKSSLSRVQNKKAEPFELLRAIEKKDLTTIIDIRQRAFPLLVQAVGGSTPLVHAMRLGKSHREVAIILTGAISKKVNELASDDDAAPSLENAETQAMLRSIRANLKIAIQYGLQNAETDLVSSYLQVSVMTHGKPGKPVHAAETIMNKWATRELKDNLAAVGEFAANAIWDLILLAFWNIVTDKIPGEAIPSHYYGRDTRIASALQERIEQLKATGDYQKVAKSTREALARVLDIVFAKSSSSSSKIEKLRRLLDDT